MINSLNGSTPENHYSQSRYKTLYMTLHEGDVKITFKKKDGTSRTMTCTLREDALPKQTDLEEQIQKKKKNTDVLAVWDLEKQGWRSFRYDSIVGWGPA